MDWLKDPLSKHKKEQLKLLKVVRDGFLIIVAGPGNEEGEEEPGEREGRVGLIKLNWYPMFQT